MWIFIIFFVLHFKMFNSLFSICQLFASFFSLPFHPFKVLKNWSIQCKPVGLPTKYSIDTLYNVCSVHRGMFNTSGDVQYIGGCSIHRKVFSTSGDIISTSGGYHEYIGGCSVHRGVFSTSGDIMSTSGDIMSTSGDIMSTSVGYHEYIGGCSVHRGDIMIHVGGYHEYIGGCSVHQRDTMSTSGGGGRISWVHRGMFSTSNGYHDTCGGATW